MMGFQPRLALTAFALALFSPATAYACDPVSLPLIREAGSVLLLATVRGAPSPIGTRRVEVLDGRAGTDTIARGPAVLVPWSFGIDCSPVPWGQNSEPWLPPASPAVYTAVPRARAEWIGGVRTFDVFMAHREPVWRSGEIASYGLSGGRASMTPAEFLVFYATFPTQREVDAQSPLIERRIAAWEDAHRAKAAREPALTMLMMWRKGKYLADFLAIVSSFSYRFPEGAGRSGHPQPLTRDL